MRSIFSIRPGSDTVHYNFALFETHSGPPEEVGSELLLLAWVIQSAWEESRRGVSGCISRRYVSIGIDYGASSVCIPLSHWVSCYVVTWL
jgi:hypothetical protein